MSESAWYVAVDGEIQGPCSPARIRELVGAGQLGGGAPVWRHPMPDWQPLSDVEELAVQVPPPLPGYLTGADAPAVAPVVDEVPQNGAPPVPSGVTLARWADGDTPVASEGRDTHPWRRFFARMSDYALLSVVLGFGLAMSSGPVNDFYYTLIMNPDTDWLFALLVVLLWVPLEARFLSSRSATPGKWLMSLRVVRKTGGRPAFGLAFRRAGAVMMRGVAFGVPYAWVVAVLVGATKLERRGETTWDARMGTAVHADSFRAGRIALFLLLLAVSTRLFIVGSEMV